VHYRGHVAVLVAALETDADCHVAYSDLYRTVCRIGADGRPMALAKVLAAGRSFDRSYLPTLNHVHRAALMHRRDLLERTGPFDERLGPSADWDMVRRMASCTDFAHVPSVTGEIITGEPAQDATEPAAPDELPFRLDRAFRLGRDAEADGRFARAADIYDEPGAFDGRLGDRLLAAEAAAAALWRDGGQDSRALRLCRLVNDRRPTVATLLLEARLLRRNHQADRAVRLLERAAAALDGPHNGEELAC
jgi:hypothetical protein